jgi:signal transduction histidine kinase
MLNSLPFAKFVAKLRLEQPVALRPGGLTAAPGAAITYAPPTVEAGLLPAFRVVIGLELLLSLVGVTIFVVVRGGNLPSPLVFSILGLLLLFGYLCSEQLQTWLGELYLPVGLVTCMLLPLLDRLLFIRIWMAQHQEPVSEQMLSGAGWRVLALLLIPLVFTAWQYDFGRVLLFAGGVLVTDLALLFGFFGFHSELRLQIVSIVLSQSIIFVVVGYIITRMMYAQREQRRIVDEANQQLTHYAAAIEQLATSRERNRLARELHDTLAHSLSALAVQLDAVDTAWDVAPIDARTLLIKAMAQTRSGLTETRRALQALRASPLEDLGLRLALLTLAKSQAQRAGWQLDLQLADDLEGLPPDLEQIVYRVAAEALNNTVKHAAATTVALRVGWIDNDLELQLCDDGIGFRAEAVMPDRFGLTGMRERAAMAGGTLTVASEPGKGTTLTMLVPTARAAVLDDRK